MNFYFEPEDFLKETNEYESAGLNVEYLERDVDLREIYETSQVTTSLENINF